jgi:hypothetical protein
VLNPDSLVPPLKHGPILFFLATLVNTAVRMRLPDDQWNECVIDLDGIDARGRLHFSCNGRPFVTIPLRILPPCRGQRGQPLQPMTRHQVIIRRDLVCLPNQSARCRGPGTKC